LRSYKFDSIFIFNSSARFNLIAKIAGIKNIFQYPIFNKKNQHIIKTAQKFLKKELNINFDFYFTSELKRAINSLEIILKILNKIYPKTKIPLEHISKFTLLVSVLLSAQTTDVNVNNVTKNIYPKYNKPKHFVKLGRKKIEKLIKSIGIFRVKAKSIYLLSKQIIEKHKGKVPKTFEELERLPGVGHKTASVVMAQGFGKPAFPVDTHIHRLAQRWGLTNGKNVIQTESDLKRLFPKKFWNKLHLQIIYYGRTHCRARECYGLTCKICTTCYPGRKSPIKTKKA